MDAAPGKLVRETKRAASYLVESPLDFEGKGKTDFAMITQLKTETSFEYHSRTILTNNLTV